MNAAKDYLPPLCYSFADFLQFHSAASAAVGGSQRL
jgi:hypothetical protein